jgi:hypothetical protein
MVVVVRLVAGLVVGVGDESALATSCGLGLG